jgi:hypothetical protein
MPMTSTCAATSAEQRPTDGPPVGVLWIQSQWNCGSKRITAPTERLGNGQRAPARAVGPAPAASEPASPQRSSGAAPALDVPRGTRMRTQRGFGTPVWPKIAGRRQIPRPAGRRAGGSRPPPHRRIRAAAGDSPRWREPAGAHDTKPPLHRGGGDSDPSRAESGVGRQWIGKDISSRRDLPAWAWEIVSHTQ